MLGVKPGSCPWHTFHRDSSRAGKVRDLCGRAILDVVVDVRVGSPTFGRWEGVRLDDQTRRAVFLAEGLGHSFMALTDKATVVYLCSTPYAPGIEHGVNPLDPVIGISWPDQDRVVVSEKDAAAPSLAEAERAGLLPGYASCLAQAAERRAAAAH